VATDPLDRLRQACLAAIERCDAKESEGIDPDTFAELGESLFWLCALAEATGRHKTELLRGLRWARNRIAHGVILTAVGWHYGTELDRWVLGRGELGTTSGHEWLTRDAIVTSRTQRRDPAGEMAYDKHLAGQRVLDVMRAALHELTARG
jgi:hypothetical protein